MQELIDEWRSMGPPRYIERELDDTALTGSVNKVIVLTGCRRSGKTYTMFQMIDVLHSSGVPPDDVVYINLEDERIERTTEVLTDLLPLLVEGSGNRAFHLFLDEIHTIPKWDLWVRRIHDRYKDVRLYLSSSSSRLSMTEIPESLRGRTRIIEIFPLSFPEFARFNGSEDVIDPRTDVEWADHRRTLWRFLEYGAFPEVALEENERIRRDILQDYFRTIIALDISARFNVSNVELLNRFIKLSLAQSLHSSNKLYNVLRSQGISVGKGTLLNFTRYMEDVFLAFFVPLYSTKVKDHLQHPRKIYFVDTGLTNQVNMSVAENRGRNLENAVHLHLRRTRGLQDIFYWQGDGTEVDFCITSPHPVRLIQSCVDINDPSTFEREVQGLLNASHELSCDDLTMVTIDRDDTIQRDDRIIRIRPFVRWIMEG